MSESRVTSGAAALVLLEDRYPPLRAGLFTLPQVDDLVAAGPGAIFNGSVSVMLLVVFETLLSGKLADKLTATEFDAHQELIGVGVANLCCGLTGGFPCTAALARTNLNVRKGATSRSAGLINAVTVFFLSTVFSSVFRYLPLPFVASMMYACARWSCSLLHARCLHPVCTE
eukprot:m.943921 g.943921  ORF g.943921 m.943921 type:complete len:172 (+) comp23841_c0_seq9:1343-1858(+)